MGDLELRVNGRVYSGWQTATVSRGIETIAGSFELGVSERWNSELERWPIAEGDECALTLNGKTVVTGYIDSRHLSYGNGEHEVAVSGRDKTGALVDCSVYLTPPRWEFKGVSLLRFAELLCQPFDVRVVVTPGLVLPKPPAKMSVDPGDTAFNALEHACRAAGVLLVSDGNGELEFTRAGTERCSSTLKEGANILTANASFEFSSRFRKYVVLGQRGGNQNDFGEAVSSVTGSALDMGVNRPERVLVVRPESGVTAAQAQKRAQWEAITRAARAETVTVTVQGWAQENGELWPINKLVRVSSPTIGVDGEMLISRTVCRLGVREGSTTELSLCRPDAFSPEPQIPRSSGVWKEIAGGV